MPWHVCPHGNSATGIRHFTMDSGFPHGRDSWISATGTGWAAIALTLATEPANATANLSNALDQRSTSKQACQPLNLSSEFREISSMDADESPRLREKSLAAIV